MEKERIKDQSWCCGGGGGARTAFLDFAQATAGKLIDEVKNTTDAEAIVTCCPFCEQNIGDVLSRTEDKLELIDLIALVKKALMVNI